MANKVQPAWVKFFRVAWDNHDTSWLSYMRIYIWCPGQDSNLQKPRPQRGVSTNFTTWARKDNAPRGVQVLVEAVRFELTDPFGWSVFKTGALNRALPHFSI